ncbi:hypothetical protein NEFER03_2163 [Nematocida sp. LUAm3]|nr:hypothetical protein NEFER03_2163 [Nematocida sp. LUAm3]KAI5174634.1 hypothetical protein NEFER02_0755 [Nematocida sp. LUAm2]KAI5177960.1 hypothetical protein NEFER01_1142 [Nematocida sp. LUAm1]
MHREHFLSEASKERREYILKKYAEKELSPEDHFEFLLICRALNLTEKTICSSDSERAEVLFQYIQACKEHGIDVSYDMHVFLEETLRREELEKMDRENDHLEIEISREKSGDTYSLVHRRNELLIRREELKKHEESIRVAEEHSAAFQDILSLAKSLSISTREKENASFVVKKEKHLEEFHSLFLPCVSLSMDAVSLLYAQIEASPENKEKEVLEYIEHMRKLMLFRRMKEACGSSKVQIEFLIVELLWERKRVTVCEAACILEISREEAIEAVFVLVAKEVIYFHRASDTIELFDGNNAFRQLC